MVNKVTPKEDDDTVIWEVETSDLSQQPAHTDILMFDAVFVCVG